MIDTNHPILELLRQEYPDIAGTELRHSNPWQLLVATILSAQTTDKLVNMVTKDLFKKYSSQVNLPEGYSIHSLRHTCAMLKAKNNESPIKIMLWLRHRSVMSTQRYFERVAFEREAEDASIVFGGYM